MALAPMANVTDAAFRRMIARYGKPSVIWTEFVSVEALLSQGRDQALVDFWYSDIERPIVAQIFGSKPEQFKEVAQLCRELGFDGIDINMGCPDKGIEKSGAGAALIKNPALAKKIILSCKEGAGDLPVSVKTRIGYKENEIESWTRHLLEAQPAAITMHGRTRKEMSKVGAHWDVIGRMVEIVAEEIPKQKNRPVLLGNGDVETAQQGREKCNEFGVDGVMIGRGFFGKPWLLSAQEPGLEKRLDILLEHSKLYIELFGPERRTRETEAERLRGRDWLKSFDYLKKHYKAYCSGFEGAKELRVQLMEAKSYEDMEEKVREFLGDRL